VQDFKLQLFRIKGRSGAMSGAVAAGEIASSGHALQPSAGSGASNSLRPSKFKDYYFVYIGLDAATGAGGAAGEIANVTQVFQPPARRWASNSQ
jgi:hypothetical protein